MKSKSENAIELIVEKSYPLPDEDAGVRLMYAITAVEMAEEDARERAARIYCFQCKTNRQDQFRDCKDGVCELLSQYRHFYDHEA